MNTNMTRFRWLSKIIASKVVLWTNVDSALEGSSLTLMLLVANLANTK